MRTLPPMKTGDERMGIKDKTPQTGWRRVKALCSRFARNERGVTVIEFAILGPIFFALIGATIETALAFFAGYALDAAVIDSSRLMRTGQESYISETSADNYRAALCAELYGMFDCSQLKIAVRPIASFAGFAPSQPINPDTGEWTMTETFQKVEGNKMVMIEAYYKWPTLFNIPELNAGQTADGKRLLAATHVFKTEPF